MFKNEYPFVSIINDLLEIKRLPFFLLLCTITFLLLFIKKNFIEYEITAFQILDERGQLGMFKAISTLQYFSIPLIYLVKFTFIAFFIGLDALHLDIASHTPTAGTLCWFQRSFLSFRKS